jgi:hypothetical protein
MRTASGLLGHWLDITRLKKEYPKTKIHEHSLFVFKLPSSGCPGLLLNMAEIELSVLKGQCLDRRIPDMAMMHAEVAAWEKDRNNSSKKIVWQFKTPDARIKLRRHYPNL